MNHNAQRWVAALRSGTYEQAQGALRIGDAYCCLGIACEIAREELNGQWVTNNDQDASSFYACNGELGRGVLTPVIADWLGLNSTSGLYDTGTFGDSLASLNDGGASFDAIADMIESEPEGLFAPVVTLV